MRKLAPSLLAAAVVCTTASACAGATTFGQIRWVSDPQSFIAYGATDRDLMVEVLGKPFASDQSGLGERVAAGMQAANAGPGTHFTTRPGSTAQPDFRVVVAFDRNVNGRDLCGPAEKRLRSTAIGGGEVTATLCDNDKPITSTTGNLAGISSPQDQAFSQLMKFMALDLFPGPLPWRG